jgi:4-hydroxybenzoate polyprenyltransferase
MVKFPHSLFALPFAFSGAALAAQRAGISAAQVFWIAVAMVGARNAAMGFNRLADHAIDARNPRTAGRELPAGKLSRSAVWAFTAVLAAVFVFASFRLNRTCGLLAPVALATIFGYSYTKRFTWASHLVLGLALAMAPVGGWLAIDPALSALPWMLALAVLCWVAGFDVIYACQDFEFDRAHGLRSIPAAIGIARALWIARALHGAAVVSLAAIGVQAQLHPLYWAGVAAICVLLVYEHRLVRADDLSKLGVAFFQMNGVISVVYLAAVLAAIAAGR